MCREFTVPVPGSPRPLLHPRAPLLRGGTSVASKTPQILYFLTLPRPLGAVGEATAPLAGSRAGLSGLLPNKLTFIFRVAGCEFGGHHGAGGGFGVTGPGKARLDAGKQGREPGMTPAPGFPSRAAGISSKTTTIAGKAQVSWPRLAEEEPGEFSKGKLRAPGFFQPHPGLFQPHSRPFPAGSCRDSLPWKSRSPLRAPAAPLCPRELRIRAGNEAQAELRAFLKARPRLSC